jgi:hypothetical protein
MTVADELDRLHRLHQDGILSDEELDRGRAAVLIDPPASPTADQLDELRRQKEAARLDREWEAERERYMARDKAGDLYIPSRAGHVVGGVLNAVFGLVWVVVTARTNVPVFVMLIGIAVALVGVGGSTFLAMKAGRHLEARRRYQRRRAAILNGEGPPDEPTC